jgi:hypothetical protein
LDSLPEERRVLLKRYHLFDGALRVGGVGSVCAACLARAHARSGDPTAISGYLGNSNVFDKAVSKFAVAYADQTEKDHQTLKDAVSSGEVTAETGI